MRLVLDTNVVVSGLIFPNSLPGKVLTFAQSNGTILQSSQTLEELADVLQRPKFDRWISRETRAIAFIAFVKISEHISDLPSIQICRDPRDNCYLELASAGRADFIVTGDEDLLVLSDIDGALILTPRDFLTKHAILKDADSQ